MAADAKADAIRQLPALELRDRLASGALRAAELAEACIARIEARDAEVGAWAWFDADYVRQIAGELDKHRTSGAAIGPLHGVPVGIKDIVDTVRIPTENGTELDAGRIPTRDAWVVSRLKQAGALIMGKTVTTELAFLQPAKTRNPCNPEHTPGGSSSGSAAAVADRMVPLAIGTQTGGSVIRPAAYCDIVGFKPSFGAVPRTGILTQAPSLDTVGVFAGEIEGAALLAEALYGYDESDSATSLAPHPRLLEAALSDPPVVPSLAFVKQPAWADADDDTHEAFAELVEALGEQCQEIELPSAFAEAANARERIHFAEMAKNYHHYVNKGRDKLGAETLSAIDRGAAIPARDYISALDWPAVLNAGLEEIFFHYDAILTPAAAGAAPKGFSSTGSPAFNGLWTLCGTPAITIPLLKASNGMPMGVQLVGPRGGDARLLRSARWLAGTLESDGQPSE